MRKDEGRVVLSAVLSTKSMTPPDNLDDYGFLSKMFAKCEVSIKNINLFMAKILLWTLDNRLGALVELASE